MQVIVFQNVNQVISGHLGSPRHIERYPEGVEIRPAFYELQLYSVRLARVVFARKVINKVFLRAVKYDGDLHATGQDICADRIQQIPETGFMAEPRRAPLVWITAVQFAFDADVAIIDVQLLFG
jgi:hypothetical protein